MHPKEGAETILGAERTRPFTQNDIFNHANGTAVHNDLNHPDIQEDTGIIVQSSTDTHSQDSRAVEEALKRINKFLGRQL